MLYGFSQPLVTGSIVKRYQRFFIDIQLDDGRMVTAHCVNTGSMATVLEPGRRALLEPASNPTRRLAWTLEAIHNGQWWIGVNTHRTNQLAGAILQAGLIPSLTGYTGFRSEVKADATSRMDWLLTGGSNPDAWVEVKNTTLLQSPGVVSFPDSVSQRGLKHILTLQSLVAMEKRGVMFYLVNRPDANRFTPAGQIDPAYARALRQAALSGVEVVAARVKPTETGYFFEQQIPVDL